jgi:signal transduction histidine kinase
MDRAPKALRSAGDDDALRERAALLGHDIRNAVSDILGGLSLADLSPLDAGSSEQLVRVHSAAEQLARLSDEVLALITGEAGPAPDGGAGLRVAPLLEAVEARWAAHARERGLRFRLVRGADLPPVIGIDPGALERILANVIGNAVKYAGRGEVRLEVTLEAQETLAFCIEDDGPSRSAARSRCATAPGVVRGSASACPAPPGRPVSTAAWRRTYPT